MLCDSVPGHHVFKYLQLLQNPVSFQSLWPAGMRLRDKLRVSAVRTPGAEPAQRPTSAPYEDCAIGPSVPCSTDAASGGSKVAASRSGMSSKDGRWCIVGVKPAIDTWTTPAGL